MVMSLTLYTRDGCHLCDETRRVLFALLNERRMAGLTAPELVEQDIATDPALERAYFATVPVVELDPLAPELDHRDRAGRARHERRPAAAPAAAARRPARGRRLMLAVVTSGGTDLTFAVAIAAGLISFLSPCVLPLVPAYLGQLTAIAVAGGPGGVRPSRWIALRHAVAYVLGFGVVFTLLGVTATYAAGGLVDYMPLLRQIGGVLLIVLGLNLAGILTIPVLDRVWRPLDAGASGAVAGMTGTMALAPAGGPSRVDRLGGWIVGGRTGWFASFGLGAIFAIGWTPCIGIILGGILTLAATGESALQGAVLLVAYTLGLGIPFLVIAAAYDRAPGFLAPLLRRGRLVSLIGGLLVVAIGVAMVFDWLALLPQYVPFNTQI